MKKYMTAGFAGLIFLLAFSSCAPVVQVRPTAVVRVRPAPPSPRHVWVDGNWVWRHGRYVWVDGYYVMPRAGAVWVPGRWKSTRRGFVWVDGHWRY